MVYAARQSAAKLATALGMAERAAAHAERAEVLRARFEESFWCEELGTYALALDGGKRPCIVRASNAGQCLYTGIASAERARRVARALMEDAAFSGWGVRTVAASEARYNPMSYHNGSIWPHDNALIAAGLARYGLKAEAQRIFTGMFDASLFFDLHRLPELFCGFERRPGESPTQYPVSCSPQSWASGAALLLLQSCMNLQVHGTERRVVFARPTLPECLRQVQIRGLRVADSRIDLSLQRTGDDVAIDVLRRDGPVEVVTVE